MYPEDFLAEHDEMLRTIEMNVVVYYRNHPKLVDHNVEKVYNGIQRTYEKEIQGKTPPRLRFKDLEQDLFDMIEDITRFYVGELEVELHDHEDASEDAPAEDEETDEEVLESIEPVSKEVIVQAMKKLRRSINIWTGNTYGRQGYLDYISKFM